MARSINSPTASVIPNMIIKNSIHLRLTVTGTRSFEYAQVCAGGIDTAFVNAKTMESKKVPGLYFAGEILDVDGACGGYNLQWAWSSGYLAGYYAANDQKGQVEQNA